MPMKIDTKSNDVDGAAMFYIAFTTLFFAVLFLLRLRGARFVTPTSPKQSAATQQSATSPALSSFLDTLLAQPNYVCFTSPKPQQLPPDDSTSTSELQTPMAKPLTSNVPSKAEILAALSNYTLTKEEKADIHREEVQRAVTQSMPTKGQILEHITKSVSLDQATVNRIIESSATSTIEATITSDLVTSTVSSALPTLLPSMTQALLKEIKSAPWLKAAHTNLLDTLRSFRELETNFQLLVEDVKNIKTNTELLEPDSTEAEKIEDLWRGLRARVSNIMSLIKLLPRCCAASSRWAEMSCQVNRLHDNMSEFVLFYTSRHRRSGAVDQVANLERSVAFLNESRCTHRWKANAGAFSSNAAVRADLTHVAASNEPSQQAGEVQAHPSPVSMRVAPKIISEIPAPHTALPSRDESNPAPASPAGGSPQSLAPKSEAQESLSDRLRDISSRVAKLSDNCTCGAMQGMKKDLLEQCEGCEADSENPDLMLHKDILDDIESELIVAEAHECQVPPMATAPERVANIDQSDLSSTALNTPEVVAPDQGDKIHQSDLSKTTPNTAETTAPDGSNSSVSGISSTPISPPVGSAQIDEGDLYDSSPQMRPVTSGITDVSTFGAMLAPPGDSSSKPVLSAPSHSSPATEVSVQPSTGESQGSQLVSLAPESIQKDVEMKFDTKGLEVQRPAQSTTSAVAPQSTMTTNFERRQEIRHRPLSISSGSPAMETDMDTTNSKESHFPTANLSSTAAAAMDIDAGNSQETLYSSSTRLTFTEDVAMDLDIGRSQDAASVPYSGVLGTKDVDMHTGELQGADSVDTPNSVGITDTAMDTGGLEETEVVPTPDPAGMTDTDMDTGGLEEAESVPAPNPAGMTGTAMDTGGLEEASSVRVPKPASVIDTMETDPPELPVTGSIPSFDFSSTADILRKTNAHGSHMAEHAPASAMSPPLSFGTSIGPSTFYEHSSPPIFQSPAQGSFRKPGIGRYGLKELASRRAQTTLPQSNVPQAILPSIPMANTMSPTSVVPQSAVAAPTLPAFTLPAMMVPQKAFQHTSAPNTPIPQCIRADQTVSSAEPQRLTPNTASKSAVSKTPTSWKRPPTTAGVKPLLPKEPTNERNHLMAEEIMRAIGLQGGVTKLDFRISLEGMFKVDSREFIAVRKTVAGFFNDEGYYLKKWSNEIGETLIDMDEEVTREFVRAQVPFDGIKEWDLLQKFAGKTEFIYDPRLFDILSTVAKKDDKGYWYRWDEKGFKERRKEAATKLTSKESRSPGGPTSTAPGAAPVPTPAAPGPAPTTPGSASTAPASALTLPGLASTSTVSGPDIDMQQSTGDVQMSQPISSVVRSGAPPHTPPASSVSNLPLTERSKAAKIPFTPEKIMWAIGLQGGITAEGLQQYFGPTVDVHTRLFKGVLKMVAGMTGSEWYLTKWTGHHGEAVTDYELKLTAEDVRAQIPSHGIKEDVLLRKFQSVTEFKYDPRLFPLIRNVAWKDNRLGTWYRRFEVANKEKLKGKEKTPSGDGPAPAAPDSQESKNSSSTYNSPAQADTYSQIAPGAKIWIFGDTAQQAATPSQAPLGAIPFTPENGTQRRSTPYHAPLGGSCFTLETPTQRRATSSQAPVGGAPFTSGNTAQQAATPFQAPFGGASQPFATATPPTAGTPSGQNISTMLASGAKQAHAGFMFVHGPISADFLLTLIPPKGMTATSMRAAVAKARGHNKWWDIEEIDVGKFLKADVAEMHPRTKKWHKLFPEDLMDRNKEQHRISGCSDMDCENWVPHDCASVAQTPSGGGRRVAQPKGRRAG